MWPRWLERFVGSRSPRQHLELPISEDEPGTYVIGQTKDLVKHDHLVAADDPRRSLFVYHKLREEEERRWTLDDPRRELLLTDAAALNRLERQIPRLSPAYTDHEMQDLIDVIQVEADTFIASLCHEYSDGGDVSRSFIRSQIDAGPAWTLLTFSKRAAILAVRQNKPELIRDSLIAHAMENLAAGDVRDNLVALGLVFHCARAVSPVPRGVFEEVAAISGRPIARLLTDLIDRPDLDEILPAMGWHEVETPHGVGYRWGD